jgi:nitroreductase
MEAINTIMTRRSVRKYTSEKIRESDLEIILRAGMQAPSAGNERPWHFLLITERKILDGIPKVHQYAEMLREAQAAILVCCDLDLQTHKGYWPEECGACMENMLLASHSLGLGSVWVGVYPNEQRVEALRHMFNMPETVVPFAIMPIGHPAERKPREDRYEAARIHKNKW